MAGADSSAFPPGDKRLERGSGSSHQRVQLGDLGGEMMVGVQVQPAHLRVRRGEPAVAGHLQLIELGAQPPLGQVRGSTPQPPTAAKRSGSCL
jgi:hypothetical protein